MLKYISRFVVAALTIGLGVVGVAAQDSPLSTGEIFVLQGQVLDTNGDPLTEATVEIWQTDANGIYNHPNAPGENLLDPDFQYFGTAATDADGYYAFRTIKPRLYGSRPAHIHFKVRQDNATLLTSQFYFIEFSDRLGSAADQLVLLPQPLVDDAGDTILVANRDIVIDLGADGLLTPTPPQQEGPFYPVVDFSDSDNDLTVVTTQTDPIRPLLADEPEAE